MTFATPIIHPSVETSRRIRMMALGAALFAAFGAPLTASTAAAQDNPWRSRTVTVENGAGETATVERSVSGSWRNRSAGTTVTGPEGGQWSRSFERDYDADTQTYSRSTTQTGPAGNSRTFEGTTRYLGDGEYENTRSVTGPRGGRERTRWIRVE